MLQISSLGRPDCIFLKEYVVLEHVEGEIAEPTENSNDAMKVRFKKRKVKAKNIILNSLGGHLIMFVVNLKKSKEMYDKHIGMY